MAEAESHSETTQPDQPVAAAKPAGPWRRLNLKWLVGTRTLVAVALCSIALNAVGFGFIRTRMFRTPPPPSPEIALGTFQFQSDGASRSGIVSARFNLHVNLLKDVERAGRAQLVDTKFRLQQDIEELLRRAHGADFEDPALAELKRQVQEQVNATLGMRAVSGVIITDLALRRGESHAPDAHATDAHATDAHGTDAHATDAHATDAHATDAHGTDAHGTDAAATNHPPQTAVESSHVGKEEAAPPQPKHAG